MMKQNLIPTTVYLSDAERKQISLLSSLSGKSEADVRREVLKEGLAVVRKAYPSSTQGLRSLRGIYGKEDGLPTDLARKHDEYTWD